MTLQPFLLYSVQYPAQLVAFVGILLLFKLNMKLATVVTSWLLGCLTIAPALAQEAIMTLDSGEIRVGVDREKGASITWLSSRAYPSNMVNLSDPGRLIQQSYYAGRSIDRTSNGQSPSWSPWPWNPIQGGGVGSWARATVFERQSTEGNAGQDDARGDSLYSETTPKLWDMPDEAANAVMRQWTSIETGVPATICVRCQFESRRHANDRWGAARQLAQELPACYFTRNFSNVKSYLGDQKWRDEIQPSGPPWGHAQPPLAAMACFNEQGQGVAVFSPAAKSDWNFGPHGDQITKDPMAGPCMHVAPIGSLTLGPATQFEYRYWLVVGDEAAIASSLDALIAKYSDEEIKVEH